jgi:hypothetical protein
VLIFLFSILKDVPIYFSFQEEKKKVDKHEFSTAAETAVCVHQKGIIATTRSA